MVEFYNFYLIERFIYSYEYVFITNLRRETKMANKDGKGPQGKGPKTGRQEGDCEGAKPLGRRMGRGRN